MNISLRRFLKKLLRSPSARRHARVGPAEMWKMKRAFQIDFLERAGLEPHHRLLDIGCGTLRGGIPLIDYLDEGHYCGVEVRADVLEEGRRELHEAGLEHKRPRLLAVDRLSDVEVEREFDFAWAFSVLFHMSDEIVDECIALVERSLAPGGVFYANVNIGDRPPGNWQGFPVMYRSMEFYRDLCARHGLGLEDVGSLAALGHVSGDEAQDRQRMLAVRRS